MPELISIFLLTKQSCGATNFKPLVAKIRSPLLSAILGSSVHGVVKNVLTPLVTGQQTPL